MLPKLSISGLALDWLHSYPHRISVIYGSINSMWKCVSVARLLFIKYFLLLFNHFPVNTRAACKCKSISLLCFIDAESINSRAFHRVPEAFDHDKQHRAVHVPGSQLKLLLFHYMPRAEIERK